jgi:hypothetical protein
MGLTNLLLAEKGFNAELLEIIRYISIIFGGLVILYAIYLGYLMATASDAGSRAEAKKRVINALGIVLIIVALVGMLAVMDANTGTVTTTGYTIEVSADPIVNGSTLTVGFDEKNFVKPSDFNDVSKKVEFTIISGTGWVVANKDGTGTVTKKEGEEPSTSITIVLKYNGEELARRTISAKP